MTISLFENKNFKNIIEDFKKDFKISIEYKSETYFIFMNINGNIYNIFDNNLEEAIKNLMMMYLLDKTKGQQNELEFILNDWKNLDQLFNEVKEL